MTYGGAKLTFNSNYENALDATHGSGTTDAAKDNRGSPAISLEIWEGYEP